MTITNPTNDALTKSESEPPQVSGRAGGRWRRRAKWGLIVFLAVALLLEVGLRWSGLAFPLLLQADPQIGYLFQPNQELQVLGKRIRINEFHQRSDSLRANTPRILMIGDSVTFGGITIDQSQTITSQLERQLGDATPTFQVLNASAGSWGLPNQRAYLDRFGLFDADLLIVQVGSHDLFQPASTSEIIDQHPSFPSRPPFFGIVGFLERYAFPRIWPAKHREIPLADRSAAQVAAQFETNMTALQNIFALAKQSQTPVMVVHTPNRSELNSMPSTDDVLESSRTQFLNLCAENSVVCLDLHRQWMNEVDSVPAYYRDDIHLTPAGNLAVAQSLAELIQTEFAALTTRSSELTQPHKAP